MSFNRSSSPGLEKEIGQLREEITRLKTLADLSWMIDHPVPSFIVACDTKCILEVNHAATRQYRYDRSELLNQSLEFLTAHSSGIYSRKNLSIPQPASTGVLVKQLRRDGTIFTGELVRTPITYGGKSAELVQVWDISRQVDAELNLRTLERRYHWFMDQVSESIWRTELEMPIPIGLPVEEQIERCYRYGYIAEVSKSTARLYGYPNEQAMVGTRLESLLPRNPQNHEYLRQFIQNGYQLSEAESQELDAQGNTIWFLNKLVGEVEGGLLVRAWGTSLNITERKRVEAHQKRSDQMWRDALEHVQLLAYFLDNTGTITYINPFFSKLTGWEHDELLGQSIYNTFQPDYQFPRETQSQQGNSNLLTRSGKLLQIHWNTTLIHDEQGKPLGVFSIGEDVTEQQRVHGALKESEDRYRRLVEGMPLGLYRSTPEGQLTFANPVVLNLLGLSTVEEAARVNLNQYAYGPAYSREEFQARLEREGEVHGLEFKWNKPGGETLWVREHSRAIRDEFGQIQCYEGTLEDITREKKANRISEEREEHYRMLSQLAPIGIFMTCQGIVVHANQYLTRLLGFSKPEELEGMSLLDLLHPSEREEVQQVFLQGPEIYGQLPIQERRLLKKDGSTLLVQGHIARVHVNNQRGSVIVVRDVTAERQTEMERRRWQQRILEMQKLESLGLLAGGLAHDFNNQLTVILGHANLLQKQLKGKDDILSLLAPIEQAAIHSTELCLQMLSFAGRGRIQVQHVNLTELVQASSGLLRIACAKKARLQFELADGLPPIQAEEAQLRQVLINLVSNSSDAMTGEQPGEIVVRTGRQTIDETYQNAEMTLELPHGEYLYLEVSDTGSGMDVNTRRRVFEPFFTTKPSGRGLGLAAVLGIVRSHGGAIELTSKLRHGSTFKVFLPIKRAVREVMPHANPEEKGQNILVVDDDASLRNLTSRVLKNQGWNVIEAEDGHSACDLLRLQGGSISLALIDLVMPNMDGVDTLRQLWKLEPTLPAVAMSSFGSLELEKRFEGFPLRGILPKPFTPATLIQAVEHVLGPGTNRQANQPTISPTPVP
ncbi:MAG: PAS domain S-box protein [Planctomycetia bacterium]|nr:PAS domain S-box protein [Planctomycetia bacterium]